MFKADKTGFFVIDVDLSKNRIVLSFHDYSRKLRHRFTSKSAEQLWDMVIGEGLVSELSHAAYLGTELAKAEIALKGGLRYRQDEQLLFGRYRRPR